MRVMRCGVALFGFYLASSLASAETVVCTGKQTTTCDAQKGKCTSDEMLQWNAQTHHFEKVKVLRIVFTVDRAKSQITDDSDNTYTMLPAIEVRSFAPDWEHTIMAVRTTPAAVNTLMLGERSYIESLVANVLGDGMASMTIGTCKGLPPMPTEK